MNTLAMEQKVIAAHCMGCREHRDECICPRTLWDELPREDMGTSPTCSFFIGLFWALAIEAGFGLLGWIFWMGR